MGPQVIGIDSIPSCEVSVLQTIIGVWLEDEAGTNLEEGRWISTGQYLYIGTFVLTTTEEPSYLCTLTSILVGGGRGVRFCGKACMDGRREAAAPLASHLAGAEAKQALFGPNQNNTI
jgi:hypothetical protein